MCCHNRVKVEDLCQPIKDQIADVNGPDVLDVKDTDLVWVTCGNCNQVYNGAMYPSCAYCTIVINPLGDKSNAERRNA